MESESRSIIYASAPMPVSMGECWYDVASLDHFWIRRRFEVFKHLANERMRKATCLAEIGCGNGLVQRQIEDHYAVPIAGFDLNELALKRNLSRSSPVYCYDIRQRSAEFHAAFDFVVLFDVLEHIDDETGFLQSLKYHLSPSGILAINVPAYQALYSKFDRAAGHVRRYSIRSLSAILQKNGLSIHSYTYWGSPLLPLLVARKAILALRKSEHDVIVAGFDPGGRARNRSLGLLASCESLPQRFLGTSLMAIVELSAAGYDARS